MNKYNSKEFWMTQMHESWVRALKDTLKSEYVVKLMTYLDSQYKSNMVYPSKKDVFKVFRYTAYDKVDVVILGQDPYHDGSATGVAFANDLEEAFDPVSPSLRIIMDCVTKYMENERDACVYSPDFSLKRWLMSGVMPVNTALTVRKKSPNSHKNPWNTFTHELLLSLNKKQSPVAFVLWGAHAQSYENLITNKRHAIFKFMHPAASAYKKIPWKCNNFKQVDKFMEINGKQPILW